MRLEDIARKANVSISTVSRVVNGVTTVSAPTKKRVLKALEEVNYHPNLQARSLVAGESRIIGVVVSNLLNPFFVDVFHVIEGDAAEHGYELLMANTNYESDRLAASVRLMLGRRVSGLILIVSEPIPPVIDEILQAGIPTVFYDVGAPGKDIVNIKFDSRKGMTQLVEHLYSLGHRRMAHIGQPLLLQPANDRRLAFFEAAERLGAEAKYFSVPERDGFEGGRDAARQLLRSDYNPTAILCINDITAIGVLRELRNQNIDVPGEVSVTGFDNIMMSEFCAPSLTTIHIPREKIAHMMFKSVIADPAARESAFEYVVGPELVVRESSGIATSGLRRRVTGS